jgi:hypothetical protein
MIQQSIITMRQIPTQEMAADGLTKPLNHENHSRFLQQIGF